VLADAKAKVNQLPPLFSLHQHHHHHQQRAAKRDQRDITERGSSNVGGRAAGQGGIYYLFHWNVAFLVKLFQLRKKGCMAPLGIEPVTFALLARRSNQLS
jgi:hypothetical protein